MLIGVDPGVNGGFAVEFSDGAIMCYRTPMKRNESDEPEVDYRELIDIANRIDRRGVLIGDSERVAIIEKVNYMPVGGNSQRMPPTRAGSFGSVYGTMKTVVHLITTDVKTITAMEWSKALGLQTRKESLSRWVSDGGVITDKGNKSYTVHKDYLCDLARSLYPEILSEKTKGWSMAVCDALLILRVCRMMREGSYSPKAPIQKQKKSKTISKRYGGTK